jgi:pimeloyl-ACP methyl ester carboxylesterase
VSSPLATAAMRGTPGPRKAEHARPCSSRPSRTDNLRSNAATPANLLPLNGLNAWRIYLDLPRHGRRAAGGAVASTARTCIEEWVVDVVGRVVAGAVEVFSDVLAELGARLPLGDSPLGLLGAGVGGVVAQLVLAEAGLPVRAAAFVDPLARLCGMVDGTGVCGDGNCCQTGSSRRVADRLYFVARAHTVLEHQSWPVLILVTGVDDHEGIRTAADELWYALSARNPERTSLVTLPNIRAALAGEPGTEPAPQSPDAVRVDMAVTDWFRRSLTPEG